ncbi:type II secretion system protein GspM [Rhodoferax aquaticus]|uniref:Type II secretion system protein M n=1 Tax=Rhodoferax aquaticus TaxID=2527691 RepID=A0A515ELE4_9BURK|nr:type II secretion system protein GspM [Rhodoferax aquaticus]QDL53485.1 type II secretion system protein M [Rhodoferax aquaticus]
MKPQDLLPLWQGLSARDQRLLKVAASALLSALVWLLAVAPALRTLQQFEPQYRAQETQLQAMLALQTQAQKLQGQVSLSPAQAAVRLKTSAQAAFGSQAEVRLQDQEATITLQGVAPEVLAQWLATARTDAHALPTQAKLSRTANGWSGTLRMALPS